MRPLARGLTRTFAAEGGTCFRFRRRRSRSLPPDDRPRPLVLGHRGASPAAPENTLDAFALARELGADGVELDVRRTADGVLVVHHDPDGRRLRAARRARRSPTSARRGRASPTLDEALDACRGLLVNAEVKCLPWEPDADPDGIGRARRRSTLVRAAGTTAR